MRVTILPIAIIAAFVLAGCTSAHQDARPGAALAQPDVVMDADPPPPFTYWAPEGSMIRNHPRIAGVWIAETEGIPDKYYFGDQCRASEFQRYVGHDLDMLPEKSGDAVRRLACSTCSVTSDLGWARMNIFYDEETRIIETISCG
ncbi:hypothetical protein [Pseudochelatococcus contaminans]|uniref:Uncharacterized protein n=1 Tax=Pseudochelatococcus contaminans TaxID=1538103 RepID=A0A7W5Z291_9HYPH|nr:hypothetical protein [Pseudochelatococcus contaminans]MBB3808736.1 hypothetical protein [Pseudochelatococcus contaminans]